MDVHTPEFGTAVQGWKHFAGIEETIGVKRTLDALLLIEIVLVEHCTHKISFLDTNAVLTGQHPAHLNTKPEDISAEILRPFQLAGLIGVIKN